MPPSKPRLSDEIIADLTAWVRMGAPDPREGTVTRDRDTQWEAEFQARLDWWSLRPVADVAPPDVAGDWPRDAVDRFILGQLTQHRLHPAADADALTLLRRLSFVLTGLPPSSDLVKTFRIDWFWLAGAHRVARRRGACGGRSALTQAALSSESPQRHPLLHRRRSQSCRHLRSQADVKKARRRESRQTLDQRAVL